MLSIPFAPLVFIVSVAVALGVGHIASRRGARAGDTILGIVLVALSVSRLAFVAAYLPAYRTRWFSIIDIRDLGFAPLPGLIAGTLIVLWVLLRRADLRRPVALAVLSGLGSWIFATTVLHPKSHEERAPRLELADLAGHMQPLERADGKPLVVNLWASWCGPCRTELPMLEEAQTRLPDIDIELVNEGEALSTVSDFLLDHGLKGESVMLDPDFAIARSVGAEAYPTTLFYDKQGKLLAVHLGLFSRATFQDALAQMFPDQYGQGKASHNG